MRYYNICKTYVQTINNTFQHNVLKVTFVLICQIPNKTMTNKVTKMNAIKEKGANQLATTRNIKPLCITSTTLKDLHGFTIMNSLILPFIYQVQSLIHEPPLSHYNPSLFLNIINIYNKTIKHLLSYTIHPSLSYI